MENEFEKIDRVLKYICEADKPPFRTDGEISKECGFDQNAKELFEILFQLEKDKFTHSELNNQNIKRYYSTFKGRMFLQSGGYDNKFKAEKANLQWSVTKERVLHYGSILAAIFAICSILQLAYRFFCWLCCHYCH